MCILSPLSRHAKLFGSGVGFAERLLILDPYFQSIVVNQVFSLPVSTTSCFRHVVSTVQTRSAMPTTLRSSIDTGGGLLSIHFISRTNSSPPRLHFSFLIDSFSNHIATSNKILNLASDRNHSTSTEILLSRAFLMTSAY